MKNRKNSSTSDLEAIALIAGVILILSFGLMVFEVETASVFLTLVLAMGILMNGMMALERFRREKTVSAIFFTAVTVVLLMLFVLRLFLRG